MSEGIAITYNLAKHIKKCTRNLTSTLQQLGTTAWWKPNIACGNRQRMTGGRRVWSALTWHYREGNGQAGQPPFLVSCSSQSSSDATMDIPSDDDEPDDSGLTRKDREVAASLLSVNLNVAA